KRPPVTKIKQALDALCKRRIPKYESTCINSFASVEEVKQHKRFTRSSTSPNAKSYTSKNSFENSTPYSSGRNPINSQYSKLSMLQNSFTQNLSESKGDELSLQPQVRSFKTKKQENLVSKKTVTQKSKPSMPFFDATIAKKKVGKLTRKLRKQQNRLLTVIKQLLQELSGSDIDDAKCETFIKAAKDYLKAIANKEASPRIISKLKTYKEDLQVIKDALEESTDEELTA
ncbi:MAG: hypothetical protein COB50_02520, partial [Thiotrichales bacterium]